MEITVGVFTGLIAIAGIATALAATRQARAVERSNKAFVVSQKIAIIPHLDIEHGHSTKSANYFELTNNGLGPAEIVEFVIYLDGKPVDSSGEYGGWPLAGSGLDVPDNFAHIYAPGVGTWIRPGQSLPLFRVEHGIDPDLAYSEFGRIKERIGFRIVYRSRYGEEKVLERNLRQATD